jgi:hypothetical protein
MGNASMAIFHRPFGSSCSTSIEARLPTSGRTTTFTSATVERNLAEIEQRVQILSSQIHILNDQFTAQLIAIELQLKATDGQVQNLRQQYELRLKELEDASRVRGLGSGPPR